MKNNSLITVLSAAALCAFPTFASAQVQQASASDRLFIHEAALGGNDEIALSKVAEMRATDPNIRNFAHRMVVQHSEAGAKLKIIAMSLGVRVPAAPDPMHRAIKAHLLTLNGEAFNRAYINAMVKDHTAADHLFQMGTTVTNDRLRSFALATLPVVENHLKMATSMQQGLSGGHMAAM